MTEEVKEKMTKTVAVLGGTGAVGRHFVDYALERGYAVRMLCRVPSKVTIESDKLTVLAGDSTKFDDVRTVSEGSDVLVSCLGNKDKNYIMRKSAKTVVRLKSFVPKLRVVAISSLGMGGSSPFINMMLRMINWMIGEENIPDYEEADALLTGVEGAVVVRPDALGDGPGKGKYTATLESGMGNPFNGTLSKQDVALFFADLLEDDQYDGKAVQLYTAK